LRSKGGGDDFKTGALPDLDAGGKKRLAKGGWRKDEKGEKGQA